MISLSDPVARIRSSFIATALTVGFLCSIIEILALYNIVSASRVLSMLTLSHANPYPTLTMTALLRHKIRTYYHPIKDRSG